MSLQALPMELRDLILDGYVQISDYWREINKRVIQEVGSRQKHEEKMYLLRCEILGYQARKGLEARNMIQYGGWWLNFIISQVQYYGEERMVEMYGLH
jgi:hypothetical protein